MMWTGDGSVSCLPDTGFAGAGHRTGHETGHRTWHNTGHFFITLCMALIFLLMFSPFQSDCSAYGEPEPFLDASTEWTLVRKSTLGEFDISGSYGGFSLELGGYVRGYLHRPDLLEYKLDTYAAGLRKEAFHIKAGSFREGWYLGGYDGDDAVESIMLTDEAPGSPSLLYGFDLNIYSYERYISSLNEEGRKATLIGHRLLVSLPTLNAGTLTFGVRETAILGEGVSDLALILGSMPVYPLYLLKYIPGIDTSSLDNMNIGLEAAYRVSEHLGLFGEIHVCEWPMYPGAPNPKVYGIQLAGVLDDMPLEGLSLELRYKKLTNFLYGGSSDTVDYVYNGMSLGDPLGQDARSISAEVSYKWKPDIIFRAGFELIDKGEGKLGEYSGEYSREEKRERIFLGGIVEKRRIGSIGFSVSGKVLQLFDGLNIDLELSVIDIENAGHVSGEDRIDFEGRIKMEYKHWFE